MDCYVFWIWQKDDLPRVGAYGNEDGSVPTNKLLDRFILFNERWDNNLVGIWPSNELLLRFNISKFGSLSLNIPSSIVPFNWLLLKSILFKDSRRPISVINVPVRPLLCRFISVMNLLLSSHLIPLKSHKCSEDWKGSSYSK